MDDMKAQEGIDFFDFLYEIWQAKWMFLLIVIGCTVLAAATSVLRNDVPVLETTTSTTVQVGFNMSYYTDPHGREAAVLLNDWIGLVDADDHLGLQYAGKFREDHIDEYNEIVGTFDRSFGFKFINSDYYGWIVVNAKDGDAALYTAIHEEFIRAAEQQFVEARAFAERVVASYPEWGRDQTDNSYLSIPDSVMASHQFLEVPSVRDGTFRFVKFKPLDIRTIETSAAPVSSRSPMKVVILGAIIGFILACVFIMFRIAIKRKRTSIATAG